VIQASTQYNLSDNNTQLTEPVATEACDPAPDVEEIRQCFIDEAGNQWTQVIVIDPSITDPNTTNVIAEFFYDEFLGLGTPVGSPKSWTPCPNPSGLTHVESCICFEYLGEIKKGYAYYYTDGEVQYGEDGDPDNAIVGAAPFCCDDCIQVFGCRDGRLAWPAGSNVTMSNGDVLDIGGLRYTEVAQLIVDNYGGSFLAPSLGGPFGPNFSGCQQSSSHELQFYNLDVAIASIDELEDFGAFGTCQDESLGGSCENPVFVRECPDEPCPDPSIEIYCDSDPAATQYVVVTHASELCGTSGSFIASDYYATPRVLTSYTPVGSPQLCPDSSITEQKCQIDECGTRWSCVTVITPTAGGVVQSETCVPYITLDCSSAQNRQAKTKSIKLSVAEVNTQLAADPPTPVGQLCDCPCPTPVMQTRCTCINGVKVEVEFGIYADSGNYVGWFRRSDTGELLTAEPTWVDCCGECV
jgi:hypothetical protein